MLRHADRLLQVVYAQAQLTKSAVSSRAAAGTHQSPRARVCRDLSDRAESVRRTCKGPDPVTRSHRRNAQKGVRSVLDLTTLTPNLQIATTFGNTNPQITLRGIVRSRSTNDREHRAIISMNRTEPAIAKLGQLFGPRSRRGARGPQGTLYGRTRPAARSTSSRGCGWHP